MASQIPPTRYLEFGAFRLDLVERILLRESQPVPLTPKAFDTLLALVQNRGHILSRDELMKIVWPDTIVEENNLTQNISLLRKVLDDTPGGSAFIETVPKRGYRFVARVTERLEGGVPHLDAVVEGKRTAGMDESTPETHGPKRRWTAWVGGLAAILAMLAASPLILRRRNRAAGATGQIRSLAVLPLENLSRDPNQEYFADGMTDELITDLAEIRTLRVVSRTSVMRYKNTSEPLPRIARELNVDAVVEGAVLTSGSRVRITAQLIQANSDRHLWAKSYEAKVGDIVTLQDTVAREIAGEIQATLTPEEGQRLARRRTVDPQAFRDYLMGRYFWNQRTLRSIRKSIFYFDRATAQDGNYAPAYAGLAASYVLLGFYGMRAQDVMPKAEAFANEALNLDGSLPEAHASLGAVDAVYKWDWEGARKEFRRALELNPNYAPAHHWCAVLYLAPQGRFDEAIKEMKQALALDPVSPVMHTDLGWVYFLAGQDGEAIAQYHKALDLDPDFLEAHDRLARYYLVEGMHGPWLDEFVKGEILAGRSQNAAAVRKAYQASGFEGALQQMLRQKQTAFNYPLYYSLAGEKEHALNALEKAYRQRDSGLIYLKVDPLLASLRSDPRFTRLVRRMGLSP